MELAYGVMVALQILVLPVQVRILVSQQKREDFQSSLTIKTGGLLGPPVCFILSSLSFRQLYKARISTHFYQV